jgi:hypothetical protein
MSAGDPGLTQGGDPWYGPTDLQVVTAIQLLGLELNGNIKIPAKVFAEVKPVSQGTAGTIYKCLGAVSKTVEIAGG